MNIFVLDTDPQQAATLHLDKHVVKMPLETAQMLCTINAEFGVEVPYKSTHKNHPCTLWAKTSKANYYWLVTLGMHLCKEYTYRYNKVHACQKIIEALRNCPASIPDGKLTSFAQAMPDDCKQDDAPKAYQMYYKQHKNHIAKWTGRATPSFMLQEVEMNYVPAPELQIWAGVMPFKYVPDPMPELTPEQQVVNAEFVAAAVENKERGWSND